jgi:hypothetical protein
LAFQDADEFDYVLGPPSEPKLAEKRDNLTLIGSRKILKGRVHVDELGVNWDNLICSSSLEHYFREQYDVWIRRLKSLSPRKAPLMALKPLK